MSSPTLFSMGGVLDKSWQKMRPHLPIILALSFVSGIALYVFNIIPFLSFFAAGIQFGFLYCLLRVVENKEITMKDYFWCFTDMNRFLHMVIMQVIVTVMTAIALIALVAPIAVGLIYMGFMADVAESFSPIFLIGVAIFCILIMSPAIYYLVSFTYSGIYFVTLEADAIAALKASFKISKGRWWHTGNFLFLLGLINLGGALCLLIGLLVTIPITTLALYYAVEVMDPEKVEPVAVSN